jgi:hypothetical protein
MRILPRQTKDKTEANESSEGLLDYRIQGTGCEAQRPTGKRRYCFRPVADRSDPRRDWLVRPY